MLQPDALAKLGDTLEMSFEDQFPWPEPPVMRAHLKDRVKTGAMIKEGQ